MRRAGQAAGTWRADHRARPAATRPATRLMLTRHRIVTRRPSLGLPCWRCRPPPRPGHPDAPILVVDDDAKIVRLVRTYLERDGFTVVTAADGPAALDAIETPPAGARRPRPDAPRAGRAGRHPRRPPRRGGGRHADPHPVGPRLDHRPHRRPRGRRRRLPAQAVLAGRARPARQVDPAPRRARPRPPTRHAPAAARLDPAGRPRSSTSTATRSPATARRSP